MFSSFFPGLLFAGVAYGGMHLLAWDPPVETEAELLIWRDGFPGRKAVRVTNIQPLTAALEDPVQFAEACGGDGGKGGDEEC
jgi:hypothetical protein